MRIIRGLDKDNHFGNLEVSRDQCRHVEVSAQSLGRVPLETGRSTKELGAEDTCRHFEEHITWHDYPQHR